MVSNSETLSDIAAFTDARAETFSFSDLDSERILSSLTGTSDFLTEDDHRPSIRQLEYFMRKEVNYRLHTVTLAEYFRAKRIPRGLRILLKPTLCRENPNFLNKWRCILNKCSLDLVLLTVEELQKESVRIQTDIADLKTKLQTSLPADEFKDLLVSVETTIQNHKIEVEKTKIKKFKRDTFDYANNCVYTWFERFDSNSRQKLYKRHTGEVVTSDSSLENLNIDDGEPSTTPSTSGRLTELPQTSFLGRGRGRGKPGGGREPQRFNKPITRSQINL